MFRNRMMFFFLALLSAGVLAAPELRISSIEVHDQSGETKTSLMIGELKEILVVVQNIGSTFCDPATVVMDINRTESSQSILRDSVPGTSQPIEMGQSGNFVFNAASFAFNPSPPADGVYRVVAIAQCNDVAQNSRTLSFSFFSKNEIGIPEAPTGLFVWVGAAVALMIGFSRKTGRTED